jgi:hypothetical protein
MSVSDLIEKDANEEQRIVEYQQAGNTWSMTVERPRASPYRGWES